MSDKGRQDADHGWISRPLWGAILGWTLVVGGLLAWDLHEQHQTVLEQAALQASVIHEKDVLARRWNARHGGVYVPVTPETPPNIHLNVPERDITTPSGRRLTLINPAYMTRQLHEMARAGGGTLGHITSLKPIRPGNAPDPWERSALEAFGRGTPEVRSIEDIGGEPHMRLMRPLYTEPSCLKCHAAQGYRVGQIRGGISTAVSMRPFRAAERERALGVCLSFTALWLAGLCGILVFARSLSRRSRQRTEAVDALRLSERRYRELADSLPLTVFELDEKARLTCVNETAYRMMGYTHEQFLGGLSALDMLVPEDRPRAAQRLREGRPGELAAGAEYTALRKDGGTFPALIQSVPRRRNGRIVGYAGILMDISERKRAEQAVRDSEQRLRVIFDSAHDGIVMIDVETEAVRSANAVFCRMLGYEAEEITTLRLSDVYPADSADWARTQFRAVAAGELDLVADAPIQRRDGSVFRADIRATPVTLDGRTLVVGFIRDITERKKAEAALREGEVRYRRLIDNMPVGIYRNTPGERGQIILANPAVARMFGYDSVEELCRQDVASFYPDPEQRKAFSEKLLASGKLVAETLRLRRRDGTEIWCAVTATVTRDAEGNVLHFDGLVEDITERRGAEQRLQRTLSELERFNRLAVGREIRMVELKREINQLCELADVQTRYDLSFAGEPKKGKHQ